MQSFLLFFHVIISYVRLLCLRECIVNINMINITIRITVDIFPIHVYKLLFISDSFCIQIRIYSCWQFYLFISHVNKKTYLLYKTITAMNIATRRTATMIRPTSTISEIQCICPLCYCVWYFSSYKKKD